MKSPSQRVQKPQSLHHRWLLLIPFFWQGGLAPAVNHVALAPFGIPFPMAWQMAGILLASLVIGVVFKLDRHAGVDADEENFLENSKHIVGDE